MNQVWATQEFGEVGNVTFQVLDSNLPVVGSGDNVTSGLYMIVDTDEDLSDGTVIPM